MKAFQAIKFVSGALIVIASLNAYAQSSDAAAADTASSATSAKAAKKETRAANRKLARQVRATLAKTKGVSATNITVRANNGAVTLEGTVPDQSQSDKAAQAAQGVAGVTSVKNALTLRAEGQ